LTHTVPILVYHSVDAAASSRYQQWAVAPEILRRHLALIHGHEFKPLSVAALVSAIKTKSPLPSRTVVVTFDDGLRDFLTGAMPVLGEFGCPATLFVVSGLVGKTSIWLRDLGEENRPMLSWSELREIADAGIECGAHTVSHPQLDIISRQAAQEEIKTSKKTLEDRLGRAVQSFAYPHGYATRVTRRLVEEAGYSSACRVRHALSRTDENLFGLSRIVVTADMSDDQLLRHLGGHDLPIAPPLDRTLSHGWRLVRRLKALH
jgi:peptidoglycan/xylan/chitin deacetylase (PgdA/CDA1 family)